MIRQILPLLFGLTLMLSSAWAEQVQQGLPTVSAIRAYEMSQAGEWYLVDIRSRGEWRQGVAEGAYLISMHEPGFLQKLEQLTGGDREAKIAIICAVGGRTSFLQPQLMARGWKNIYDVSEGMKGAQSGPGWEARGLPVIKP